MNYTQNDYLQPKYVAGISKHIPKWV